MTASSIGAGIRDEPDSICECTYCPSNTKQCAHFDGHWVRLTHGPDCTNKDGVPAVAWNFGKEFPNFPSGTTTWTDFYHPPLSLSDAEEYFHVLNSIMRKFAREEQ